MIRKVILLIGFIIVCNAYALPKPKLYLNTGYPYMVVNGDKPRYVSDFLSIGFGGTMQIDFNEYNGLALIIDGSYTPYRTRFSFDSANRPGRSISGETYVLTSFYSINYTRKLGVFNNKTISLLVGPSIGIYTLSFSEIDKNNSAITENNRIRIRNIGGRLGFRFEENEQNIYYEIAGLYSLEDKYTRINDASPDAEYISEIENKVYVKTWGIMLNIGLKLF